MLRRIRSAQESGGSRLKVIGIVGAVLGGLGVVGILVLLVVAIGLGEEQRHQRRHDVVSAWQEAKTRINVHARLGKPTFATRVEAGRRSASCDVFNAYDSIVDAWVQFTFCYDHRGVRVASPEPLEPNEDVAYLRTYEIPPLTRPAKPSAKISARLDDWPNGDVAWSLFDAEDVYRVWVPPRRALHIRLVPTANVALEVWDSKTSSVRLEGAARDRHLITFSDESGTRPEEVTLSRPRVVSAFIYLDVSLLDRGPNHAEYELTVTPST
jgi:hypothetical protein